MLLCPAGCKEDAGAAAPPAPQETRQQPEKAEPDGEIFYLRDKMEFAVSDVEWVESGETQAGRGTSYFRYQDQQWIGEVFSALGNMYLASPGHALGASASGSSFSFHLKDGTDWPVSVVADHIWFGIDNAEAEILRTADDYRAIRKLHEEANKRNEARLKEMPQMSLTLDGTELCTRVFSWERGGERYDCQSVDYQFLTAAAKEAFAGSFFISFSDGGKEVQPHSVEAALWLDTMPEPEPPEEPIRLNIEGSVIRFPKYPAQLAVLEIRAAFAETSITYRTNLMVAREQE